MNKKILVAYFSHSNNTHEIAKRIHENIGGSFFEIVTVEPYPHNYNEVVEKARKELESGYKPILKTKIENIDAYDVVCIGYPNWWGTIPQPVVTFLSQYDLSGKIIIPFCTHEGGGLGRSVMDITKFCPNSIILEGLAVRGGDVKNAQNKILEWLSKLEIME